MRAYVMFARKPLKVFGGRFTTTTLKEISINIVKTLKQAPLKSHQKVVKMNRKLRHKVIALMTTSCYLCFHCYLCRIRPYPLFLMDSVDILCVDIQTRSKRGLINCGLSLNLQSD